MCKAAVTATGGAFLTLFVGATTVAATTRDVPWYETTLWAGAGLTGALFFIVGATCLSSLVRKHLKAIDIRSSWRCTYWRREKQLRVTVWFEDRLRSAQHRAECTVQVGDALIRLNDDVKLGGTYLGRHGLIAGHSGPVMAEFLKKDVALDAPDHAIVRVRIQPRDPWGMARDETKTIPIQIINHGNAEAAQSTPAPEAEAQ